MTRKSKREVEKAIDDLDIDDEDRPQRITIRREVIDQNGEVVDTLEKVIDR